MRQAGTNFIAREFNRNSIELNRNIRNYAAWKSRRFASNEEFYFLVRLAVKLNG